MARLAAAGLDRTPPDTGGEPTFCLPDFAFVLFAVGGALPGSLLADDRSARPSRPAPPRDLDVCRAGPILPGPAAGSPAKPGSPIPRRWRLRIRLIERSFSLIPAECSSLDLMVRLAAIRGRVGGSYRARESKTALTLAPGPIQ